MKICFRFLNLDSTSRHGASTQYIVLCEKHAYPNLSLSQIWLIRRYPSAVFSYSFSDLWPQSNHHNFRRRIWLMIKTSCDLYLRLSPAISGASTQYIVLCQKHTYPNLSLSQNWLIGKSLSAVFSYSFTDLWPQSNYHNFRWRIWFMIKNSVICIRVYSLP